MPLVEQLQLVVTHAGHPADLFALVIEPRNHSVRGRFARLISYVFPDRQCVRLGLSGEDEAPTAKPSHAFLAARLFLSALIFLSNRLGETSSPRSACAAPRFNFNRRSCNASARVCS